MRWFSRWFSYWLKRRERRQILIRLERHIIACRTGYRFQLEE
jgi:hypothetical protein